MTLRPLGVAAAAMLTLSLLGCSADLNPGTAAKVNDESISKSQVDDLVMSACAYTKISRVAAGTKDPQSSMAALRQVVVGQEVFFALVDQAADKLGITVSDAGVDAAAQEVPAQLSGADATRIRDFFHAAARAQLQQAVIGAHTTDPSIVTNSIPITQEYVTAGKAYLAGFSKKQDVDVNPEFGSWNGSAVVGGSGSLSVAVSDQAAALDSAAQSGSATDLPPSQVCG